MLSIIIKLINLFERFDFIHPDGIGVYFASKYLYKKSGLTKRFTGSDFYPFLIEQAIERNWKLFFFGDSDTTLEKIKTQNLNLNVVGIHNGYDYVNLDLVKKINISNPDILIVGLGCPKQEKWIIENYSNLNVNVIIAVGDGIKVFAGNKIRGPLVLRQLGLEWFVRLISNFKNFGKDT